MEEQLSKKERKDLKRQERRENQVHERRAGKAKKLAVWAVLIGVIAVAGWFGIQAITPEPLENDYSRIMRNEGSSHVQEGTRVTYQSNPPTITVFGTPLMAVSRSLWELKQPGEIWDVCHPLPFQFLCAH